ncbi:hypothetical protein AAFF_G00402850 [Aldrovandia affinis]|uniref:Uncharacterized protein n=1 Tax=Aldrovandia affinis TaxID=143900 RepID=A0AAD7T8E2_9TELE|nr:hypothetical protein AAFF_G00402850 [Aldrovandia affinis]
MDINRWEIVLLLQIRSIRSHLTLVGHGKEQSDPPPHPLRFHVGNVDIAVVTPTGNYDNMGNLVDSHSDVPSEYYQGSEDQNTCHLCDAAIRRGE